MTTKKLEPPEEAGSWKMTTKKTGAAREARREKESGFLVHFQGNLHGMGLKMASKKNWWPYVMCRQTKDDIKKLAPKSTVSAKMT